MPCYLVVTQENDMRQKRKPQDDELAHLQAEIKELKEKLEALEEYLDVKYYVNHGYEVDE